MSKVRLLAFLLFCVSMFFVGCGGDGTEPIGPGETGTTPQDTLPPSGDVPPNDLPPGGGQIGDTLQPDPNQTIPDADGRFLLTTNVEGQGTVARNPSSASYMPGTEVQLTATPAAGWNFSNWNVSGGTLGTQNPVTVTVNSNMVVVARFVEASQPDTNQQTDPGQDTLGQGTDTVGITPPDTVVTTDPGVAIPPVISRLENITRPCPPGVMPRDVAGTNRAWGSRYWDCCKPHCSWPENADSLARNCDVNNVEMPCYRMVGNEYWQGQEGTRSGCDANGEAYTCYSHAPFAVCENLSFGFAAVPAAGDVCGRCYKLQFDGGFQHGTPNDSHEAIRGKIMIVMASNIGHDVAGGQFDIMIPGGGLGAFAGGCAVQWGVDPADETLVGRRFGGFGSTCEDRLATTMGWGNFTGADVKECVRGMCDNLFGDDPAKRDLWEGCIWYVDWKHAANNPTFIYEEVECPQILRDLYRTSFH